MALPKSAVFAPPPQAPVPDFEALCREYDALVRRWFNQTEADMTRFRELEQLIRKHSAVRLWRQQPA